MAEKGNKNSIDSSSSEMPFQGFLLHKPLRNHAVFHMSTPAPSNDVPQWPSTVKNILHIIKDILSRRKYFEPSAVTALNIFIFVSRQLCLRKHKISFLFLSLRASPLWIQIFEENRSTCVCGPDEKQQHFCSRTYPYPAAQNSIFFYY